MKGSRSWTGNVLTLRPNSPLQPATTYSIRVSTVAKDATGTPLAAPVAVQFTTG